MMMGHHVDAFKTAIRAAGIRPPDHIEADGRLHRFPSNGKRGDDAGWYSLHIDGVPAGSFGDWRSGVSQTWRADIGRKLTPAEETAYRAKIEAQRKIREAEEQQRREQAKAQAEELWKRSSPVESHGYLTAKGIKPHGARLYRGPLAIGGLRCDGCLVVPLRDTAGAIQTLEFISPAGEKRFLPNGAKRSHYFPIGTPAGRILVCEGYATGASLHEATGEAVAVAIDAGNLLSVAKALRAKYPDTALLIAADNDQWTAGNPGITKAQEAAQAVNAGFVCPQFKDTEGEPTDFNDLHQREGLGAVRLAFTKSVEALPAEKQEQNASGPAPETMDAPTVSLIRGSDIKPEPIRWLWDGYLARGKLHILAGAPGTGKTTIALALAATVTAGGRWPDGTRCAPGNVLIWSGEDSASDTLLPRLLAMGADRSRVYFVGAVRVNNEIVPFDPAHHLPELLEAAATVGDIRLLIVDPIVNAVLGDSHKATEVRRALQPVVDLAGRLNTAALGISHFSKGTMGRDPVERITGSVAFGALPRVIFAAAKDQDGGRILVRTKSNIGPDGGGFKYDLEQTELREAPGLFASRVLWGDALEGSAKELLAVAEVERDAGEHTVTVEVTDWLRALIEEEGGEIDKREVIKLARENGFAERTVYRARDALCCTVRTSGFGKEKRSKWALPANPGNPANPANLANFANNSVSQNAGKIGKIGEVGTNGGDDGVAI